MKQYHVPHWAVPEIATAAPQHILDIEDRLPHGSGINGDWHFEESQRAIRAFNTYNAMDENGSYCHDYPVVVMIPKVGGLLVPKQAVIRIRGRQRNCCGIELSAYIDQFVYECLNP